MTQTHREETDKALVRRTLGGEKSAFGELVSRHQTAVFNLAYRMLGNRQDAEDVAQETFLAAYRHLGSYDEHRTFKTWLLSIVHHRCVDFLRRRRRHVPLDERLAAKQDIEAEAVAGERAERVQQLLQRLSPDDRAVITLRYWEGMSYREMAAVLGVTESSVRNRLYRARRFLAEHLEVEDG